ncbi:MAG TPA: type VII secretion integral membrane protein EccD [Streptosporangiaceae bacterium]
MTAMSENYPDSALNGYGDPAAGSTPGAEGLTATEAQAAATGTAQEGQAESGPGRPTMIDDLCRLTVCGPARSVELAVPIHVPLIDMVPALVGHLGDGLADAGLEHGGWVLQRLGDPPLREDQSVAALGLHDGDVVHLRPRADQLPPLDFDDLIDGIATGISGRSDRWRPEMSRRLLTGLLAVPLAAGLVLLASRLGPLSAAIAAVVAVVLLGLTGAASRALADLPAAGVLGGAAICYAGLAAAELPMLRGGHTLATTVAVRPTLLAAAAGATGTAIAVTLLRGGRHPALVATILAGCLAVVGGVLAALAKLDVAAVAGVLLALTMPLGGWVPVLAFRMAGMRLDPTPNSPDELQAELDPVSSKYVLDRTRWADRYMTALYTGLAVVIIGCLVVLGLNTGWPARVVAIDVIVVMLLHSRVLVAARHKLAAVVPVCVGAGVLVCAAGLRGDAHVWLALVAGLVVAAGLLLVGERSLPGHKLLPHWGRAGDLLQTLTAVALIPAVLWLLNLYGFARTVRG